MVIYLIAHVPEFNQRIADEYYVICPDYSKFENSD